MEEQGAASLELMPLRMNLKKSAKMGERQKDLVRRLNKAGLLSEAGLRAVLSWVRA
jgi:hypothetical protein